MDSDSEMLLWDSGGALHRLMASLALFVQVDCWRRINISTTRAEMITNVLIWIGAFDHSKPLDFFVTPTSDAGSMFMLRKCAKYNPTRSCPSHSLHPTIISHTLSPTPSEQAYRTTRFSPP